MENSVKIIRVRRERHCGEREKARRLRQATKGHLKLDRIAGQIAMPNGTYKTVWQNG